MMVIVEVLRLEIEQGLLLSSKVSGSVVVDVPSNECQSYLRYSHRASEAYVCYVYMYVCMYVSV